MILGIKCSFSLIFIAVSFSNNFFSKEMFGFQASMAFNFLENEHENF